jgi:hypothetical protein
MDYRNNFFKVNSSAGKVSSAKRIRKLFISPGSIFAIEWPESFTDPSISEVIDRISYIIDVPDIGLFDDLAYLSLQAMELAYLGKFNPSATTSDTQSTSFRSSPFYQAMKNDLNGTNHLTEYQYKKALERVVEICNLYSMEMTKTDSIIGYLEDLLVESDLSKYLQKKRQVNASFAKLASPSISNLSDEAVSTTRMTPKVHNLTVIFKIILDGSSRRKPHILTCQRI